MSKISANIPLSRFLLVSIAAALLVAACGGSSDGQPTGTTTSNLPPPTQAVDPPPNDTLTPDENAGYRPPEPDASGVTSPDADTPTLDFGLRGGPPRLRANTIASVTIIATDSAFDHALRNGPDAERPVTLEFTHPSGEQLVAAIDYRAAVPGQWHTSVEFPLPGDWQIAVIHGDGTRSTAPTISVAPASTLMRPFEPIQSGLNQIAVFKPGESNVEIRTTASTGATGWITNPDRLLFINQSDDGLWVVTLDPQTGAFDKLLPISGDSAAIAASPDGGRFLVRNFHFERSDGDTVMLVDAASGRVLTTVDVAQASSSIRAAWSPNSRYFVLVEQRVRLFTADGELVVDLPLPGEVARSIQWAPDSSFVLIGPTTDGELFRLDLNDGSLVTLLAAEDFESNTGSLGASVAISPDSRQIAVTWKDRLTEAWRLVIVSANTTRDEMLATRSHVDLSFADEDFPRTWLFGLSWSPDSRQLAFTTIEPSSDFVTTDLWLLDADTGGLRALARSGTAPPTSRTPPVWSADGSQLLASRRGCIYACDGSSWGSTLYDVASGSIVFEQAGLFNAASTDRPLQYLRSTDGLLTATNRSDPLLAIPGMTYSVRTAPSGAWAAAVIAPQAGVFVRYAVRTDGTNHEPLAVEPPDDLFPPPPGDLASPDGTRRAVRVGNGFYSCDSPSGNANAQSREPGLYICGPDGTFLLISDVVPDIDSVHWSPDGSQIVYRSADSSTSGDIIVANADGSGAHKLIERNGSVVLLGWDADGRVLYAHTFGFL